MSLIGHLLLHDVLNSPEALEPGEVLNQLHQGVVNTLKQDAEGNKAADGMDVGMCRIDLDSGQILYSGAHRPLYHYQNGEIIQYKGNKYPVGGCQYGGKNHFESSEVKVQKGD